MEATRMTQRSEPATSDRSRRTALPDETIQQLTDNIMQVVAARVGDSDDFARFEQALLEVSNEVCQQALKKNSTR
jgi:hypothetical protein